MRTSYTADASVELDPKYLSVVGELMSVRSDLEHLRGELRDARVLLENRDDHIRRVREENETLRRELREKGE